MSINVGSAVAYLELDTSKFQAGLKNAISSLNQVNNSTGTTTEKFKNLGNGIKGVGSTLTLATVPLTAFGAGAIKTASDFQAGMSKVQALSGATSEDMKKLEPLSTADRKLKCTAVLENSLAVSYKVSCILTLNIPS